MKQHQFATALPYLETSEAAQPGISHVHLLLGRCYLARDDFEKAKAELERAAEMDPADPQPHYLLAKTYQALHQPVQSSTELAQFETLSKAEKDRKMSW